MKVNQIIWELNHLTDRLRLNRKFNGSKERIKDLEQKIRGLRILLKTEEILAKGN